MISSPYAVLAPIYDAIGMSRFAESIISSLTQYAQQQDWVGRRVIDLGCGTGAATRWLANHGYAITAVDKSPEMLDAARRALPSSGLSLTWELRDMRALDESIGSFDLALALDVFNELSSLNDLEQAFKVVLRLLEPGKLFLFDMHTIRGYVQQGIDELELVHEDNRLLTLAEHRYDYDRQICQTKYRLFQRDGDTWRRSEATRTLRAYPIQAMASLLQRVGFDSITMLTQEFNPLPAGEHGESRVLFYARKPTD
jgi:SAM-dependent methyltransferase